MMRPSKNIFAFSLLFFVFLNAASCIYEPPSWSPDGKSFVAGAFYQDEKGEEQYQFFHVDIESGLTRQLTQFSNKNHGVYPSLSPDGKNIAYYYHEEKMAEGEFELRTLNLESGESKKITTLKKDEEKMIYAGYPWSPDGKRLAFETYDSDRKIYHVMITDLSGNITPLNSSSAGMLPSWSPDGEKIAYISVHKTYYDLMISSLNHPHSKNVSRPIGLPKKHQNDLMFALTPAWSPDGRRIACVRRNQISIFDLETNAIQDLTHGRSFKIWPRWSPDGKKIALMKIRFKKSEPMYGDSISEIFVMTDDEKEAKALTHLNGESYFPQWAPTGDKIAFLFAKKRIVSFLPATVDLEGSITFFPLIGSQKLGLAKFYLRESNEKFKESNRMKARKLLDEVIKEFPKSKWSRRAKNILNEFNLQENAGNPTAN